MLGLPPGCLTRGMEVGGRPASPWGQPPQLGPLSWGDPGGSKGSGVSTSGGRARAARGQGEGTQDGADGGGHCHQRAGLGAFPLKGEVSACPSAPSILGLVRQGGPEQNWPTKEPQPEGGCLQTHLPEPSPRPTEETNTGRAGTGVCLTPLLPPDRIYGSPMVGGIVTLASGGVWGWGRGFSPEPEDLRCWGHISRNPWQPLFHFSSAHTWPPLGSPSCAPPPGASGSSSAKQGY